MKSVLHDSSSFLSACLSYGCLQTSSKISCGRRRVQPHRNGASQVLPFTIIPCYFCLLSLPAFPAVFQLVNSGLQAPWGQGFYSFVVVVAYNARKPFHYISNTNNAMRWSKSFAIKFLLETIPFSHASCPLKRIKCVCGLCLWKTVNSA